jgi:hypothetical protein
MQFYFTLRQNLPTVNLPCHPIPHVLNVPQLECSRHNAPTAKEPEHDWVYKTDTGIRHATLELGVTTSCVVVMNDNRFGIMTAM